MTGQQLKNSILQLAIQGKLVPQNPDDEPASELLKRIREEKERLVKEKKIKKEKPLAEISEDEKPFEIPEGWVWVRWGDLSYSIQYGYNAPAKETGRIRMVRISDIQNNKVMWDTVPFCDISEKEIETYLLCKNDILFARTGGTVGKSFLVDEVPCDAIYAGYLIRTRYNSELSPKYLKFFMESKLYWEQLKNGTIATAQPNCNGQTLSKMILPLPPLPEQHRIVQKIEELMPLVDEYDKAQKELNTLNANLPEALKKSILQEAIQGKLGTNNPDDEPASELLKRIREEKEKLVKEKKIKIGKYDSTLSKTELPQGWSLVKLGDISSLITKQTGFDYSKTIKPNLLSSNLPGTIPMVQTKNFKGKSINFNTDYYIKEDIARNFPNILLDKKCMLLSIVGASIGNVGIFENQQLGIIGGAICKVVLLDNSLIEYIYNFLLSPKGHDEIYKNFKSTAQGTITVQNVREIEIPLPPLPEQHRIVQKLNEILSKLKDLA